MNETYVLESQGGGLNGKQTDEVQTQDSRVVVHSPLYCQCKRSQTNKQTNKKPFRVRVKSGLLVVLRKTNLTADFA